MHLQLLRNESIDSRRRTINQNGKLSIIVLIVCLKMALAMTSLFTRQHIALLRRGGVGDAFPGDGELFEGHVGLEVVRDELRPVDAGVLLQRLAVLDLRADLLQKGLAVEQHGVLLGVRLGGDGAGGDAVDAEPTGDGVHAGGVGKDVAVDGDLEHIAHFGNQLAAHPALVVEREGGRQFTVLRGVVTRENGDEHDLRRVGVERKHQPGFHDLRVGSGQVIHADEQEILLLRSQRGSGIARCGIGVSGGAEMCFGCQHVSTHGAGREKKKDEDQGGFFHNSVSNAKSLDVPAAIY